MKESKLHAGKVVLWVLIILLAVVLVFAGVYWSRINQMVTHDVQIIERTPSPVATADTTPDTLEEIAGTPEDIGVDYEVAVEETEESPIYRQVPINEDIINILLLGQDARPGELRSRSDTMMLMSYDRAGNKATLVSLLRDCWVHIEGHGWNRLNAAYSFGGIGLLINTINDTFHIDVQNYIIVGFNEFEKVIDAFGGLQVNLNKAEAAYINELSADTLEEKDGVQQLNGAQTLIHARNRHAGGSGDFERTRRQREILLAFYQKLKSEGDLTKFPQLLSFVLGNVQINMDPNEIFTLATEALGNSALQIGQGIMPFDGTWKYANKDGRSVISIDSEKNAQKLQELLYAKDIPTE